MARRGLQMLKGWKVWLFVGPVLLYAGFDAVMLTGIVLGPSPLRTVALWLGPGVQPMPSQRQLVAFLDDPSDMVREGALIQIKIRGLSGTCDSVVDLLTRETSTDVLVEIAEVLSRHGGPAQVPGLVAVALRHGGPCGAPRYARHALGRLTRAPELSVFVDDNILGEPLASGTPVSSEAQQVEIVRRWWDSHRHEYKED